MKGGDAVSLSEQTGECYTMSTQITTHIREGSV